MSGIVPYIEQKYAVRVLLYIRDHPGCSIIECMRAIRDSRTVYMRVREAISLGLVTSEQGHTIHNRRNLFLSPTGQIVTGHILAILKEMGA